MTKEKTHYGVRIHTTGRDDGGTSRGDNYAQTNRHELPDAKGPCTNLGQMFAADWSSCFEGALGYAALNHNVILPDNLIINAKVDLCLNAGVYFLRARLNVHLPGLDRRLAQALIDSAHQTCVYSSTILGNVDVHLSLV